MSKREIFNKKTDLDEINEFNRLTLAYEVVKRLNSSQRRCMVFLHGECGAGKTTFASSLINAIHDKHGSSEIVGASESSNILVNSPTFGLVSTYMISPEITIHHFDLYRLKGPNELREIGIADYLADAISIVEWPEPLSEVLEQSKLGHISEDVEVVIDFNPDDKYRRIAVKM